MVTVIGSGRSIRRTVFYNEMKVEQGKAQCIMAANFPIGLGQTDATLRLKMLERTASLNPDVKRSSIHISMNFAPGEQLDNAKLNQIAADYMERIGFGEQPYLVYRHDDAAHPHIHIATIKIRPDGTRIPTQNIGRNLSEPARKEIELKYGLVRAEDQPKQKFSIAPVDIRKVAYGKVPTRNTIGKVLNAVLPTYRYTSLHELNAVLQQYNVVADPGAKGTRIAQHKGLIYHVVDGDGNTIGVPVKASAFGENPGLSYLEKRFLKNSVDRQPHRARIRNVIDLVLLRNQNLSLEGFSEKLRKEGIHVAVRQNEEGQVYGLTYVDHVTKCVFNGSAIGKNYSAKGIIDKLNTSSQKQILGTGIGSKPTLHAPVSTNNINSQATDRDGTVVATGDLLQYEYSPQELPYHWKKKRKKRKKR